MPKHTLEIKVYDGTELLFECRLPAGEIGKRELKELLRSLVAKHSLADDEIVAAHLKRDARGYAPLLEVWQDPGVQRFQLMCGDGVHAVVRVTEE